ncbi:flagellin [Pararobbsia alpina]|uniref:flagellin N-terminal helical domain-containing protein n=1 Tax=Pararobbsia alpina TaxID=621374 RepID=UPI0039A5D53A
MAMIINTNILSTIAQNNLAQSQAALTTSVTRLSSGLRINSAADDAAGMAISDRMSAEIGGLTAAQQNATTGISLTQTAGSALAQITSDLQRIRELAVQASNSTYSPSDRASMNQEVQQRLSEINRIASQTQYNGQNLLDGTFGEATFQVGADAGQTINVDLSQSVKTSQIGQTSSVPLELSSGAGYNLATGALAIQLGTGQTYAIGTAQQGPENGQTPDSAYAAAAAINNADINGLSVQATNSQNVTVAATASTTTTFSVNGVQVYSAGAGAISVGDMVNSINAQSSQTGVTASRNADGTLELTAADGRNISLTDSAGSGALTDGAGATIGSTPTTLYGTLTLASSQQIHLSGTAVQNMSGGSSGLTANGVAVGSAASLGGTATASVTINGTVVTTGPNWNASDLADAINAAHVMNVQASADSSGHLHLESFNGAGLTFSGITDAGLQGAGTSIYTETDNITNLSEANVLTVDAAQKTIDSVDSALEQVDALQGTLGAVQNRFSSTITELQTSTQNAQSSQSSIQDADYALEASHLSRAQVLQQAGTAMVAQANQIPQQVMKLLGQQ